MCKVTSLYPSQLQNYKNYPSCGDTAPVLWTLPQLGVLGGDGQKMFKT